MDEIPHHQTVLQPVSQILIPRRKHFDPEAFLHTRPMKRPWLGRTQPGLSVTRSDLKEFFDNLPAWDPYREAPLQPGWYTNSRVEGCAASSNHVFYRLPSFVLSDLADLATMLERQPRGEAGFLAASNNIARVSNKDGELFDLELSCDHSQQDPRWLIRGNHSAENMPLEVGTHVICPGYFTHKMCWSHP